MIASNVQSAETIDPELKARLSPLDAALVDAVGKRRARVHVVSGKTVLSTLGPDGELHTVCHLDAEGYVIRSWSTRDAVRPRER